MDPRHGYKAMRNQKARIIDRLRNLDPGLATSLAEIQLDWYRFRNVAATADKPETTEVLVYDEIGGICGLSAENFVNELNEIDTPQIDVRINSPGGSLFDGIVIYNALAKHPSHITTYVDALAASAASIIAMGGDECIMMVGSQMMIHDALGVEMGNSRDFREMADFLDRQSDNIASIYAHKSTTNDASGWRNLMLAETWMFANEAVDFGLADGVYVRPKNAPDAEEDDTADSTDSDESDDETESVNDEDQLLEVIMRAPHKPRADWKYKGGRRQAGAPKPHPATAHTDPTSRTASNSFADLITW